MLLHIDSTLAGHPPADTRLSHKIFQYIMGEITELRGDTEIHRLHNKLEMKVLFVYHVSEKKTVVKSQLYVQLKVGVRLRYDHELEVIEEKLPSQGSFRSLILGAIENDFEKDILAFNVEAYAILGTFGRKPRICLQAESRSV